MPNSLSALFSPRSIAVIGASRSPEKVGAIVLHNIIKSGYQGKVYPVNPNANVLNDIKCFKDIPSLPEVVDLALVAIPAEEVIQVITQIGDKGIKNAVVFTAGFKESGVDGEKLEKLLQDVAGKYQINVLGPNCLGFVNNTISLNATFGKADATQGNLRFISQSGAIAASLFDWFSSVNLGFSDLITIGNKAVLNESDILEYLYGQSQNITSLADDSSPKTRPIGLYLESISDGTRFIQIAKQVSRKDPIYILKPGKTPAAESAMKSHTGSMAGEDDILDTALDQAGVFRCQTLEDFFDLSKAFSWENMPVGPKVAIVSNAGGPAVISSDAIVEEGLEVAQFDKNVKSKLLEVLPRSASILNPVDVLGDALADRYAKALEIVLQDKGTDSVLAILTPQIMTQIEQTAKAVCELSLKYQKPVFCSFMGGDLVYEGQKILNKNKIPNFSYPERAIYAIGSMWKFKKQQEKLAQEATALEENPPENFNAPVIAQTVQAALKNNQTVLDNLEANNVISAAGIPAPSTKIAANLEEAIKFTQEQGFPVVLKLSSPGLLHKKSVGGVILDIRDQIQLETAWDTLQRKTENFETPVREHVSIQIQKEIPNGVEIITGIKYDPVFGYTMLFGAGGSLTELIDDKNLYLLPINLAHAQELIQKSKVSKLLNGSNGEPPYALDKLYQVLIRLSKIVEAGPEIKEIEINPVIVTLNDVWAVDPKVILESGKAKPVGPQFKVARTASSQHLAGKYYYFEFETDNPFNFQAGQYISVKVSSSRINCYSIAGHASPNRFNLLVDTTPGGPGSKFFEQLKVGDKITYLGPLGTFTIKPNDGSKNMLFLATGSGFAPLKYMIEETLAKKTRKNLYLYLGLNTNDELFMIDYFNKLAQENKNFKYQIAINKPNPFWNGPIGFITDLVKKDFPNAKDCSAYLCGNKYMINDVTKLLTDNGCLPEKIYLEKL